MAVVDAETFETTYVALQQTLREVLPGMDALRSTVVNWRSCMDMWRTDFKPHVNLVAQQSPALFNLDLPSLRPLALGQVWTDPVITPKSRQYLWQYIEDLCASAGVVVRRPTIAPPPCRRQPSASAPAPASSSALALPSALQDEPSLEDLEVPPHVQAMLDQMPPAIRTQVLNVTKGYARKLTNGNMQPEDMNFQNIARDIYGPEYAAATGTGHPLQTPPPTNMKDIMARRIAELERQQKD